MIKRQKEEVETFSGPFRITGFRTGRDDTSSWSNSQRGIFIFRHQAYSIPRCWLLYDGPKSQLSRYVRTEYGRHGILKTGAPRGPSSRLASQLATLFLWAFDGTVSFRLTISTGSLKRDKHSSRRFLAPPSPILLLGVDHGFILIRPLECGFEWGEFKDANRGALKVFTWSVRILWLYRGVCGCAGGIRVIREIISDY